MSRFLLDGKNNFANMMSKLTLLRRYCESVLYFNTKSRQLERVTEQVVFSLAAALAMALAMLIAFWSQQKYGNSSTSFLAAVVLGYIGKDRLKELGRNYTTHTYECTNLCSTMLPILVPNFLIVNTK